MLRRPIGLWYQSIAWVIRLQTALYALKSLFWCHMVCAEPLQVEHTYLFKRFVQNGWFVQKRTKWAFSWMGYLKHSLQRFVIKMQIHWVTKHQCVARRCTAVLLWLCLELFSLLSNRLHHSECVHSQASDIVCNVRLHIVKTIIMILSLTIHIAHP